MFLGYEKPASPPFLYMNNSHNSKIQHPKQFCALHIGKWILFFTEMLWIYKISPTENRQVPFISTPLQTTLNYKIAVDVETS